LAGNGGRMAEARHELGKGETRGKQSSTTNNGARGRAGRQRAGCVDGVEQLRWAADSRLHRNWRELADLLTDKALHGDLASAKALVGLAEGKKPRPKPVKGGRLLSGAARLAAEPRWQAPLVD